MRALFQRLRSPVALRALVAGLLHALAFWGAPSGAWAGWTLAAAAWLPGGLQLFGAALFATALQRSARPREAAWVAWCFGFAWLTGSVWWLFISLHVYGGLPAWMAGVAVGLFTGAISLIVAATGALYLRWRSGRVAPDALLFAALWLLAELLRGRLFTGFPWASAGYAHVDAPLAALAPYTGVYGIGAMAALIGALLAAAVARGPGLATRLLCGLVAAGLWWGPGLWLRQDWSSSAGTLAVTLVQGNVPQDQKFDPVHLPDVVNWHVQALQQSRGDLVLAAETAIPLLPAQMPDGMWHDLEQSFARGSTYALFGVPLGDFSDGYTNSAVGLGPDLPLYRYDKHHLVPFGEMIPWGFHWFVELMNIPLGDFNRGPLVAPSMAVRGQRVAPNICYEDLFGEELAARFQDPAWAPTVLANLSNLGWFGHTVVVSQHLQISRMRTLELQRPMLRATNTGATAVITHQGVVSAALAPATRGLLEARVEGRDGLTPFARWAGRWGLVPLWGVALGLIALAWALSRRAAPR